MPTKPTFKMVVIANNLDWRSLPDKIESVCDFYRPVCDIVPEIIHTNLEPRFKIYPELSPLHVVDRDWYEENIAIPHAIDADIVMFIVPISDHPTLLTYSGYMSLNNVGPWETTVFAGGEHDELYGPDMRKYGDYFTTVAEHEMSHAFYALCGKDDETHMHFPNNPQMPSTHTGDPYPPFVLLDFDFNARHAVIEWCKSRLVGAMKYLGILQKKQKAIVH